ncbi:hypothetical protein [Kocuria tytonicola]|nr:hypothetical protein [Kocuria tytonicola]
MNHVDDDARAGRSRTAPVLAGHPRGRTSTTPAHRAAPAEGTE